VGVEEGWEIYLEVVDTAHNVLAERPRVSAVEARVVQKRAVGCALVRGCGRSDGNCSADDCRRAVADGTVSALERHVR
jgi:hypothetical protein